MLNSIMEPARHWLSVTPHDTYKLAQVDNRYPRSLYVGVTGDVVAVDEAGNSVTFKAVPVGELIIQPLIVKATGTTATNIVALY